MAAGLRIQLPGRDRILSLAEVEVLDAEGTNVALGALAVQSSTGFNGPPQLAVDGNTSGVYLDGSVTHTATEADHRPTTSPMRLCEHRTTPPDV